MMGAGKRLVLEHLEKVSWEIMDRYPEVLQKQIRGRSGIYALYKKDRLYYVGLASNLMVRLKQHLKDRLKGRWDRFSVYVTVRDEHMKELESLILRIAEPAGNRTGGRFVKSHNLRGELIQSMLDADADQRARLIGGQLVLKRQRQRAGKEGLAALKGLLERRRELRGVRGGWEYRAVLRRDGTIKYDGHVYESPGAAAKAAVGRMCYGWSFWRYRNKAGVWVPLRTLKK